MRPLLTATTLSVLLSAPAAGSDASGTAYRLDLDAMLPGTTPGAMLAGTTPGAMLPGTTLGAMLAGTTPGAMLPGTTPGAMLAGTTPGAMLPGTTPGAMLTGTTPGAMLTGTTPDAMLPDATPDAMLPDATPDAMLPDATPDAMLPDATPGAILPRALSEDAEPAVLSGRLVSAARSDRVAADTGFERGSAIFIHPDGAGAAHWGAARLTIVGPDGELAWDRLRHIGVYRGHLANSLASSSHGGATVHAYGVKVPYDSYGMAGTEPLTARSGQPFSVLQEARRAGLATALVNSGHIAEPGTGVFAAAAPSRAAADTITLALIESGVDIILGGGEVLLLPPDTVGRFGYPGRRQDGRNLIRYARDLGYEVVYTRDALLKLPDTTPKVLGIFAAGHTFNARTENALGALDLPHYQPGAPTIGEMTAKTLRMLAVRDRRFLLVAEEEGSDNFANVNNAAGTLEALRRADGAFQAALDFVDENPRTLLLTAADSDAGGMQVLAVRDSAEFDLPLPAQTRNGAPLDGQTGSGGIPFVAAPDADGRRLRFGIAWAAFDDVMGGIVARAYGLNADRLPASVDNTDIYRMLYATLFGEWLP